MSDVSSEMEKEVNDIKKEAEEIKADAEEIKNEADEIKKEAHQIHEDVEEIRDNVEELKEVVTEEREDFKAKYYYLAAEMQNLTKRYEREKANVVKFGSEKILSSLLDVVDNLDRTLDAIKNDEDEKIKNIVTGIDMVRTQFLDVLKQNGLEPINAVGEIFDPNFHEALAQQPAEGTQDQEVLSEYQKGYVLNGRLLRAAKVIVAKND